jgi:hypothetical protein
MKAIGKGSLSSLLTALLNVGWYGALGLLALSVCILVISPIVDPPRVEIGLALSTAFSLDPDTYRVSASAPGVEHAQIRDVRGSLIFSPRSRIFVAGSAIVLMTLLAFILWVLGQLRAVFRTLRDGQPFVSANATRIRRIAWAVIVGELVRSALAYFGSRYAMTHFSANGLHFNARLGLNIFAIICGLIILVIAEVFRAGTRLDEEQSLTV